MSFQLNFTSAEFQHQAALRFVDLKIVQLSTLQFAVRGGFPQKSCNHSHPSILRIFGQIWDSLLVR